MADGEADVIPMGIDDPSVVEDAVNAISEAAGLIPAIPYTGHVLKPIALGAIVKAIKSPKKYVRVAYAYTSEDSPILGAAADYNTLGPVLMLSTSYRVGDLFWQSTAVHEAIHLAIDGAGFTNPFKITRFENEYVAHLGQACYAIRKSNGKGDVVTKGRFAKTCVKDARAAAELLLASKPVDPKARGQLEEAVRQAYQVNYFTACNGWWKDNTRTEIPKKK